MYVEKTKVPNSFTVTMQLIRTFIFAYAKSRFSTYYFDNGMFGDIR